MLQKEFVMGCKQGFHLRPAQVLTEALTGYESTVMLKKPEEDLETDAKSILGLMSLGLEHGQKVTVTAEGPDEAAAMAEVEKLFSTNFGE